MTEQGHGSTTWRCSCHGQDHPTDGLAWLCEQATDKGQTAGCCAPRLRTTPPCG